MRRAEWCSADNKQKCCCITSEWSHVWGVGGEKRTLIEKAVTETVTRAAGSQHNITHMTHYISNALRNGFAIRTTWMCEFVHTNPITRVERVA
jgi:hypothetical protein